MLFQQNVISREQPTLIATIIGLIIIGLILFFLSTKNYIHPPESSVISNPSTNIAVEDQDVIEQENKIKEDKKDIHNSKLINQIAKLENKKNLVEYLESSLSLLAKEFDFVQGIAFIHDKEKDEFFYSGDYAYFNENKPGNFKIGETLPGQAAKNKSILQVTDIPKGYVKIVSGLGESYPNFILFIPLIHQESVVGVLEFAGFKKHGQDKIDFMQFAVQNISEHIFKLKKV